MFHLTGWCLSDRALSKDLSEAYIIGQHVAGQTAKILSQMKQIHFAFPFWWRFVFG